MPKTWKELKAEGVQRCNGMFTNGKQCRRRAIEKFKFSWCERCGTIIKMHTDFAARSMKQQQKREDR